MMQTHSPSGWQPPQLSEMTVAGPLPPEDQVLTQCRKPPLACNGRCIPMASRKLHLDFFSELFSLVALLALLLINTQRNYADCQCMKAETIAASKIRIEVKLQSAASNLFKKICYKEPGKD